jgi:hypothetical protein
MALRADMPLGYAFASASPRLRVQFFLAAGSMPDGMAIPPAKDRSRSGIHNVKEPGTPRACRIWNVS